MFQCPQNKVVLSITDKYVNNLQYVTRMANLNHGTQVNPADNVNVIGKIESLPLEIQNRRDYEGFSLKDIQVGDIAIFRYDVVWNFEELGNGLAKFKNLVFWKAKEYWVADILQIFAVIRNDSIKMVNGYVMVENVQEKSPIVMLRHNKKETTTFHATLTQIGNNLTTDKRIDAFPGDKVFFNPGLVQRYDIKGKKFGILRQKDIMGVQTGAYGHGTGTEAHYFDN